MDACAVTQFVPGFLALAVDRIVYVTPLPSPEDADLGSLEPQLRRDAVCFIALFEVWPHPPPSTLHPSPSTWQHLVDSHGLNLPSTAQSLRIAGTKPEVVLVSFVPKRQAGEAFSFAHAMRGSQEVCAGAGVCRL